MEFVGVVVLWLAYAGRFALDNPDALLPEVLGFRLMDRLRPFPPGGIVFTGSSSIRHWWSLADDMAPLRVINRGISGARINQIAAHAKSLVLPHKPRCVVLYAGENDITGFLGSKRKAPDQVLASFVQFCWNVPDVPICFISMKPRRTPDACAMDAANEAIKANCAIDPRLHFIDVVPALLDPSGQPRADIFEADGIHLNAAGYRILTAVVRPFLAALSPERT